MDEDPTRICAKCERYPRWSRHPHCIQCRHCAGPTEVARKVRIRSRWVTKRAAYLKPENVEQRRRYALLALAGVPYAERQRASKTERDTAQALNKRRVLNT